jgi:signal transduction histidine kinase
VGDLLDFARPMRPTVQPTPLRPLIQDAVAAARAQLEGEVRAEVRVEVADGLDAVPADPRLLRQALVNLVLNGLQALGRAGEVRVRAARAEERGKPTVLISVADSGPGIAASLRPRVFQPFFTTKAKGTGLGLAVVKRIAEGHGGSVAVADTPEGAGAEFRVTLPL